MMQLSFLNGFYLFIIYFRESAHTRTWEWGRGKGGVRNTSRLRAQCKPTRGSIPQPRDRDLSRNQE